MLSTTTLSGTPEAWQPLLASMQIGDVTFIAAPASQWNSFSDGGFIREIYAPMERNAASMTLDFSGEFVSPTIADLLTPGKLVFSGSASDANGAWAVFNLQGSAQFTPRVFIALDADADAAGASNLYANSFSNFESTTEGGSIPIESILATIGPGSGQQPMGPRLTKSTNSTQPGVQSALATLTATSKFAVHEITGEWARAAVFEIAGGEPIRTAHSADEDAAPSVKEHSTPPITSDDSKRSTTLGAHDVDDRTPTVTFDETTAPRQHDSAQTCTHVLSELEDLGTDACLHDGHTAAIDWAFSTSVRSNGDVWGQSGLPMNEALEAAFEQLTSGDELLGAGASEHRAFRSSLGIMPALLFLALERVAPRKWRRRQTIPRENCQRN